MESYCRESASSTTLRIGSDGMVGYTCRNVTMEAFVSGMRTMFGTDSETTPSSTKSALKANPDLRYLTPSTSFSQFG